MKKQLSFLEQGEGQVCVLLNTPNSSFFYIDTTRTHAHTHTHINTYIHVRARKHATHKNAHSSEKTDRIQMLTRIWCVQ